MKQGALIGPIIIAIGLVVAAISFAVVGALLATADGGAELRLGRAEAQVSDMRSKVAILEAELRDAQEDIDRLSRDIVLQAANPASDTTRTSPNLDVTTPTAEPQEQAGLEDMTEVMQLAKTRFNKGVSQARNSIMLDILGQPRQDYSSDCRPVTQPKLKSLLETRQVGPIRVTMISPALDSLERIFAKLKENEPEIHDALGTAGALCARLIRGSARSVSNHSWGTAIDLNLEGELDGFADGGTQFGLLLLAELFNEEGWYWGATYRREDSMHFEVGAETLRRWRAEGRI